MVLSLTLLCASAHAQPGVQTIKPGALPGASLTKPPLKVKVPGLQEPMSLAELSAALGMKLALLGDKAFTISVAHPVEPRLGYITFNSPWEVVPHNNLATLGSRTHQDLGAIFSSQPASSVTLGLLNLRSRTRYVVDCVVSAKLPPPPPGGLRKGMWRAPTDVTTISVEYPRGGHRQQIGSGWDHLLFLVDNWDPGNRFLLLHSNNPLVFSSFSVTALKGP